MRFRFITSYDEVSQLFRAWLAISLAFAILLNGGLRLNASFVFLFFVAAFTVGVGFLLHEMGHKFVALRYGCRAEFRSFDPMLLLAVLMSFFGFVLAAPGAVFIQGRVNDAKNGVISAAGPIVNMALALIFLVSSLFFTGVLRQVAVYGVMINAWLGFFNMIPFLNLDGSKILKWSKPVYFVMLFFALVLLVLPSLVKQ